MAFFCLMHGAWHDSFCWQPLVAELRARGHDAVAPDLPLDDPGAGCAERIAPARAALDGRSDTVVVAHSMASTYAPLVASGATAALTVHLCGRLGFLNTPPSAPAMFREGVPFPTPMADGTSAWEEQAAIDALYVRLPVQTARGLARRLRPNAPITSEMPRVDASLPTELVYTSDDELFEPAWQRFMAREVLGVEPVELAGGHFPMVERPQALATALVDLAARHI
ncbi:MAG TPA: alpha/beta hydrolase [Solirubrobacteraceae bacterium]|jgi:pimeloyl-ACP methyl ester carboxylesterase|nr:alpha/beta hydrolase [Solirubrobacteraceae bacterium]